MHRRGLVPDLSNAMPHYFDSAHQEEIVVGTPPGAGSHPHWSCCRRSIWEPQNPVGASLLAMRS